MAEGYGFKMSDWVMVAIIAIGGYFAYTTIFKPLSKVTEAGGGTVEELGNAVTGFETFLSGQMQSFYGLIEGAEQKLGGLQGNVFNLFRTTPETPKPNPLTVARAVPSYPAIQAPLSRYSTVAALQQVSPKGVAFESYLKTGQAAAITQQPAWQMNFPGILANAYAWTPGSSYYQF